MQYECYFSETVNENTWEDFLIHVSKGDLNNHYQKITGYGWRDTFRLNYNGDALYIDEKGNKYKGVWFDSDNKRVAVYQSI